MTTNGSDATYKPVTGPYDTTFSPKYFSTPLPDRKGTDPTRGRRGGPGGNLRGFLNTNVMRKINKHEQAITKIPIILTSWRSYLLKLQHYAIRWYQPTALNVNRFASITAWPAIFCNVWRGTIWLTQQLLQSGYYLALQTGILFYIGTHRFTTHFCTIVA